MPATRTKAPDDFVLLKRPICPCVLIPAGQPGAVRINGAVYGLLVNAELTEASLVVHGYTLVKPDGVAYDLPVDGSSCDCMGALRWSERGAVCKHQRFVRWWKGVK